MAALELEGQGEGVFGGGGFFVYINVVFVIIKVDFSIYIEIFVIIVNQHIIHEVDLQSGQALVRLHVIIFLIIPRTCIVSDG